jgi:hypothetical protein
MPGVVLMMHFNDHVNSCKIYQAKYITHGTKNPLSFGKNLNTAVENKWIIVVLLGVGDNRR